MANIGGSIGAMKGSRREARGYAQASTILDSLKTEAQTTQNKIDPWNKYRAGYADQLNAILSGQQDWNTDPGYQFRQQESQRAIERGAMSKGYGMSGNMQAALQQRSQDIASSEYNNIINRLIGLSAATPENAIAGGQAYGNMMQTAITGQAEAAIGKQFAKGRELAYRGEAIHGLAEVIMSQGQATTKGGSTGYQSGGGGGQNSLTSGGNGWGNGTGYSMNDLSSFFGSFGGGM